MIGSDHDCTWMAGFITMQDHTAFKQLEVIIGTDGITRINIDGICALRVRLLEGCEYVVKDIRARGTVDE